MGSNISSRLKKLEGNGAAGIEIIPEHVRELYHEFFPPDKAQKLLGEMAKAEAIFKEHEKSIFSGPPSEVVQMLVESIMAGGTAE